MERRVRCTISSRMVFFYLVTTGWIFTSAYVIIQSINQIVCVCMCACVFLVLLSDRASTILVPSNICGLVANPVLRGLLD